ncbi:rhabduscin glycosyltransferase [Xenorhabdus hominickii]|uniref:N-glycosyltransferase n=1 Tax=Xenorhabdus hominickii TaxID=351679 RepID=A0A2G0Q003_XENHO|nr:rhabduscin glycosyltransferase [Xenorhabdus hominickii]AOM39171.1 N-glycosyltransferase [Xenorhabdus hominickii]PHM52554.1 putative glycosyl transferase [Xenorhabdus hominickii]
MARIVLAAVATPGHVFPIYTIAEHLIGQGHDVTIFSGSPFRQQAEAMGANFVSFDQQVDVDYRCLEKYFPERGEYPPGNIQMALAMKQFFAAVIPVLSGQLMQVLEENQTDLLFIDNTFYAALPLLQKPAEERIPVIAIGVTPVSWSSRDSIFWGPRIPPELLPPDLSREQLVDEETNQLIEQVREAFNQALAAVDCSPLTGDHNDILMSRVDRFLQLATQSFEFPRDDLPETVEFIGSLGVKVEDDKSQISWADESLPLILVTQGTLANIDFDQLLLPTMRALADLPVRVLAITGGRSVEVLGDDIPENTKVVEYLNFEHWIPRASIFITNGGYGSLNSAVRHGVPLVVAGTGDGKLEAVARVIWSRCGISLHTDTPSEQQIYRAVTRILSSSMWHQQAQIIKADYDAHNALESITQHVNELVSNR